jgi:hypothetical protein
MYLGFLVPGVVTTRIGALSSPASMAARMAAQNRHPRGSLSLYGFRVRRSPPVRP